MTRFDILVTILTQCTLFFSKVLPLKKHKGGKVSPFGGTKWATWTFEYKIFRKMTFFEVFNSNIDSFWFTSKKIWHNVKLSKNLTSGGKFSTNLTRFKFFNLRPETLCLFLLKILQVANFLKQNLTRCKTCSSENDPLWLFSRQIWHNAHCFVFKKIASAKARMGQKMSILRNKSAPRELLNATFSRFWGILKLSTQNWTRFELHQSKSDTL